MGLANEGNLLTDFKIVSKYLQANTIKIYILRNVTLHYNVA